MSRLPTLSATEIGSGRLLLRKAQATDREGLIELYIDPQVRAYLGGVMRREDVEQYLDSVGVTTTTSTPGSYVIADKPTNRFVGTLLLGRRSADRPGHTTPAGEELELSYVLRRSAWGAGLALEAATVALRTAAGELSDQPVLVVTQTANERSLRLAARLGFQNVSTFEEFGAEQTLGVARLHSFKA